MADLFTRKDLSRYLGQQLDKALSRISNASQEELSETPAEEFAEPARVAPMSLKTDEMTRSRVGEIQLDARSLPDAFQRGVEDARSPVLVAGRRLDVRVPFEGDPMLLVYSPNLYGPVRPEAELDGQTVTVRVEGPADQMDASRIQKKTEEELARFEPWIDAANKQVAEHNARVDEEVRQAIVRRKQDLKRLAELEDALEIPVEDDPTSSRDW